MESYAYNSLGAAGHERRRRARCAASPSRRRAWRRRGARDLNGAPVTPRPWRAASLCFETRRSPSAATATRDVGSAARRWTHACGRLRAALRLGEHTERPSGVRLRGGERRRRDAPSSRARPAPRHTPSSAGSSTASTTLRLTSFDYKVNTMTSPPTLGSDHNVVYPEVDLA